MALKVAIDFGLSNVKVAVAQGRGKPRLHTFSSTGHVNLAEVQRVLQLAGIALAEVPVLRVTGGPTQALPEKMGATRIKKVSEVDAIGLGGLKLAKLNEALVVSAGSGTAMVAAHKSDGARHVTGSAVGGGTLQGLARLLIGTTDAREIDALAQQGDANNVDLTLLEATGGHFGTLPADANAVNFGKLPRLGLDWHASREDLAAGLTCMVAQVIAVIALNAARAEHLEKIVVCGHLVNLPSISNVLQTVAGYSHTQFVIPPRPGYGTVLGALASDK
jgi:type II pantothenate kinase